jgi:lipopolysaccharide export system protein LptA
LLQPIGSVRAGLAVVAVFLFATAGVAEDTASLFNGFQSQSKDPIEIDAAKLEITEENDQRISVFSGDVFVKRGDTTMRAKQIRVYSSLADDRPKGQAFSRIEADGNVEVKSPNQTATGAQVVVNMDQQTITLSGNVVLSQGENVITGDRLVVELASGKARVEQAPGKRIRGVFAPATEGLGPGKKQEAGRRTRGDGERPTRRPQ